MKYYPFRALLSEEQRAEYERRDARVGVECNHCQSIVYAETEAGLDSAFADHAASGRCVSTY